LGGFGTGYGRTGKSLGAIRFAAEVVGRCRGVVLIRRSILGEASFVSAPAGTRRTRMVAL